MRTMFDIVSSCDKGMEEISKITAADAVGSGRSLILKDVLKKVQEKSLRNVYNSFNWVI